MFLKRNVSKKLKGANIDNGAGCTKKTELYQHGSHTGQNSVCNEGPRMSWIRIRKELVLV